MTYEETIKEAKIQIDMYESMILYNKDFEPKNDNSNYEHKIEFLKIAIDVLEKRIPKKPNYKGYWNGGLVYNTWICPNCGKDYEVNWNHYKYCPECGQAIDWSNDVKKTYSKDYFEGMKHFADIVLGELGSVAEYYDDMSRTLEGSRAYKHREKAIDEAMDIINAVLHLQLEAEED